MTTRPNVLLLTCDQLRFDALGCCGSPWIRTPNLDALAAQGTRFEHYFTQSPVCQPSRATLATGRYPRNHGVKFNWYDLPSSERTLQATLGEAGYDTWAVGKMHFEPYTELHGFKQRVFVEGKLFVDDDEYRTHLREVGKLEQYFEHARRWNDPDDFGARTSPLPLDDYIDAFIGRRAMEVLDSVSEPFFMWLSFVNPHMPYDPPAPYDTLYDPDEIPLPATWTNDTTSRIPEHRTSSAGADFLQLDEGRLRRVRANYFATVTLVDELIGRVLDRLPEPTIVVFTSDHGEFLGHRGLIWKGGRMLYDDLLRVPLIVRYPGVIPAGQVNSHLAQTTDLMPTILDAVGVDTPPGAQGRSLWGLLQGSRPDSWRNEVFAEGLEVKMIRDHDWKLILYPNRTYGEMYHLSRDPDELENLFHEPMYQEVRDRMVMRLAEKLIETEDPLPLPTMRPGYREATGFHGERELR